VRLVNESMSGQDQLPREASERKTADMILLSHSTTVFVCDQP